MKLSFVFFIFINCFCLRCIFATKNARINTMRMLDSLTASTVYDNRIRPQGSEENGDGPVNVKLNVYVRSINHIDDVGMNFKVQLTFRQMWNDDRLVYNASADKDKYKILHDPHKIWIPDVFFGNEITAHFHDVLTPNVLIRIYPNGNVLYSVRISLTLSCGMDLKNFPLDTQTCSILFLSYGHTLDDLVLLWKEDDPVQIVKHLRLPEYMLTKFHTAYCTSRTNTGEYSCLRIDFVFKRQAHSYAILIYIPNTMMVIISWISFWIPQKAALERTIVATGTLLALGCHVAFVNGITLPFVAYTKAIDIWTGSCLTLVFWAFVELVIVHCLWLKKQKNKFSSDFEMKQLVGSENATQIKDQANTTNVVHSYWKHSDWSHRIDLIFRIFYPVCFGVFNICYWVTYLNTDSE